MWQHCHEPGSSYHLIIHKQKSLIVFLSPNNNGSTTYNLEYREKMRVKH